MEKMPQQKQSYQEMELEDATTEACAALERDFLNMISYALPGLEESDKRILRELVHAFNAQEFMRLKLYDPNVLEDAISTEERIRRIRNSLAEALIMRIEGNKDSLKEFWGMEEEGWNDFINTLEATVTK